LTEFASMYRRQNYIKKLGANEEQIESLIANLLDSTKSVPQEKIADLINQLHDIPKFESIPPTKVPAYIDQKIEEKKRLEDEIQKLRAILDQENIDIQIIEEFKKLKEELRKYGLSIEDPRPFALVLQTIDRIGNDPRKFIRELAQIKSFKQEERRLKNDCKMWESRAARYRQVLPLCEQVVHFGIGVGGLLAFHAAVVKRVDVDSVPMDSAPYRVMQDIENYNRLGGMKKQLYDTIMNIQMVNLVSARQESAINTLMKLQMSGMTEDQILTLCKSIEGNGHKLTDRQSMNSHFLSAV